MDLEINKSPANFANTDPFEEDFHQLPRTAILNKADRNPETGLTDEAKQSATSLIDAVKGLLDLINSYLKDLEKDHPGAETGFLALLTDGASRAMRGEQVYVNQQNVAHLNPKVSKVSWAEKAGTLGNGQTISLKKQTIKASPPRG